MLISDILKKIHRKFSKDTNYPESGSEDRLVILDHVDDAITEWEDCVKEGYNWKELMTSATIALGGTGEDDLPDDFLSFVHYLGENGFAPAELLIGSTIYTEIKSGSGQTAKQQGLSPYVFWQEGGKIHTLPAVSGSVELSYLKKATRYETGEETDEPEMENPKFIEDYVTAKTFLDNADDTLYQAYMNSASEKLKVMKYNALS